MTNQQAFALWKALYARCRGKGLSHADSEDLASDALHKALAGYDEAKGKLTHFCNRILSNLVVDYYRSRKLTVEVEETTARDEVDVEKEIDMEKKLSLVLNLDLTDAERTFLTTYGAVLEELGDRAVTETARRLGMNGEEGWNLLRKIQRKAGALEVEEPRSRGAGIALRQPSHEPILQSVDMGSLTGAVRRKLFRSFFYTDFDHLAHEYFLFSVFGRFEESLPPEERQVLQGG